MVIQPGRARVYINKNDGDYIYPVGNYAWIYTSSTNTMAPIELAVMTGASQLVTTAFALATTAVMLFSF